MSNQRSEIVIAVLGAGGKMGCRITDNLRKTDYQLLLCEQAENGIARISERGLSIMPNDEALAVADYIILAVPDAVIGPLSEKIVSQLKSGATVILLDPAAAYARQVALRDDCTFVVTHPCHPALFEEQDSPEARKDMFGGIAAKQDIVIALQQGSEEKFDIAEQICIRMFAPVTQCHRITVEHMALLEPAAAEVVAAAAACIMKEAMDEVIRMGVPEAAARSFMLGHIQIPLAIAFNNVNPFSDAAKIAINYGYDKIFKPDWKQVFTKESLDEVLRLMLHLDEKPALK
ncbi:phosphogluconate dehydrogenase C-terminal domain-containing protein [Paenibacillus sp. CF384]|uniref:phosphogluconate dehydrogenase C-terminal domain-containing protein n=1 Tax=Paenibacillus sp. CF384 TaxID=1884382 RepID=UPI0008977523|nr:phosphogluconate dehydrogenase C-terminal domain-containing protein [Paenibacillus sp. CF384]SDX13605.1 Acetohydroxy acid isomeroreductase, NADPH-binding domain [Paenibacillus sp. CF384]